MAAEGNYIVEGDIDNWAAGATEAQKQAVIDYAEDLVEKVTKDVFHPVGFSIYRDGQDTSKLNLGLLPNILSISLIEISGVELSSFYYTFDKHSVYLDSGSAFNEVELRYLMSRGERALFPSGMGNIHVVGTMGWPEKLGYDNLSGTFQVGEQIEGADSGATAIIKQIWPAYLLIAGRGSTNFNDDEEIEGADSEATADVDSASGAINNPPGMVKEAVIIVCRKRNDVTLYTDYNLGTEHIGDFSYSTTEKPLTGIREADLLLRKYVRKKPLLGAI